MIEHDWEPPPGQGNIWRCRRCGICITCDRSPEVHPNYEVPRPPDGFTLWAPVLSGHPRDCDLAVVQQVLDS